MALQLVPALARSPQRRPPPSMVRSSPRGGSCLVGALSTEEARGPRERARGSPTGHGGQWTTLTDAAETLGQSSPQLLHLADLLGRLRFNEVAHLGGAGPGQLRETGPAQRSADNGGRGRAARGRRRLVLLLRLLEGRGRRAALARLRGSGLGRGWAREGVLRGAGGGRDPRRPGAPALRRRPPHFPSFVSESRAAAARD